MLIYVLSCSYICACGMGFEFDLMCGNIFHSQYIVLIWILQLVIFIHSFKNNNIWYLNVIHIKKGDLKYIAPSQTVTPISCMYLVWLLLLLLNREKEKKSFYLIQFLSVLNGLTNVYV